MNKTPARNIENATGPENSKSHLKGLAGPGACSVIITMKPICFWKNNKNRKSYTECGCDKCPGDNKECPGYIPLVYSKEIKGRYIKYEKKDKQ